MMPPLDQLRDIHAPEAISWWPPAPGWWGLLALIILIIITVIGFKAYRKKTQWRREAIIEFNIINGLSDKHKAISNISILLRQVAITRFPQQDVASLIDEDWLKFLDQAIGDETNFQHGDGRILISAPYQATTNINSEPLLLLCKSWLKKVKGSAQ